MFFLMMLSLAWAEDLLIRVAVDDRQAHRLESPVIQIGEEQILLRDDGRQTADLPNDHIFVGLAVIQRSTSVSLTLLDQEVVVGSIEVSVPELSEVTFQLKTTDKGIVLDLNAPLMPSNENTFQTKASDIILLQAKVVEKDNIPDGRSSLFIELNASDMSLSEPVFRQKDSEQSTLLSDDGSLEGDKARDQIWFGAIELSPSEFAEGRFMDGSQLLGRVKIALPSASASKVTLRYNSFGLTVKMNAQDALESTTEDSLVVRATTKGEETSSSDDHIALTVYLDDRLLQKMKEPTLSVNQDGVESVVFQDNGTAGDEEAGDGLLLAKVLISRSEYAQIMISDQDKEQGKLRVFLPSTSESIVWLRTAENGVKLLSEPTPESSNSSPQETSSSGTTQLSTDRLAHVLWVGIALFAIGFAYFRSVVFERWTGEVQPALLKLEQLVNKEKENDIES